MARRVFFSFYYSRDIQRIGQVRNSWVTKISRDEAGFWDAADWESVRKKDDDSIMRWINNQLDGTSVTIILIGAETASRPWVDYEIKKSFERGNGLLGIYIHNLKDLSGKTDLKGSNPLDNYYFNDNNGNQKYLSQIYHTYDWVLHDGYNNLGNWIEESAKIAGR